MTLKVGIIYLGIFPPNKGASGADRRVREIARGIQVQPDVELEMLVPRRSGDPDILEYEGFTIRYLGSASRSFMGKYLSRLRFWRDVLAHNKNAGLNWVLLYSVRIDALLPARLLRRSGTKLSAEFCDLRSVGSSQSAFKDFRETQLSKLDEIFIPRVTDLNIVISRYLGEHVKRQAPKTDAIRLPILVDEGLFNLVKQAKKIMNEKYALQENAFLAVYVGGLWRQEGVAYLLEGFAGFVKNNPEARLLIAGRLVSGSADHDDIEEISKKLGITGKVILPGWVSTDDVALFYSRADVLVLPQINDEFAVAALPTKLAEYSITGKPIIATRVGDVPDYFEDGKDILLVESENGKKIEEALGLLANDNKLAAKLGKAARLVAEKHFSPQKALKDVVLEMKRLQAARR